MNDSDEKELASLSLCLVAIYLRTPYSSLCFIGWFPSGPAGVCQRSLLFPKCGHVTDGELLDSPQPALWATLPLCPLWQSFGRSRGRAKTGGTRAPALVDDLCSR